MAIARSGLTTRMVSAVGVDEQARYLCAELERFGVDIGHVASIEAAGTGLSVAISDASGDYGAVIVSGANLDIAVETLASDDLWQGACFLVLQNEVEERINIAAARAAHRRGVPVCLNAAPWREMSDDLLTQVDLLVVNALEAEAMCGIAVSDLESAEAAANALASHVARVVVTAGGAGVAMADQSTRFSSPAPPVEVVSTHGAGDCFIGTLIGRLSLGDDIELALSSAVEAAARLVADRRAGNN